MVPIPEGIERYDGEPPENLPPKDALLGAGEDHNLMRGSGGSLSDEKRRTDKGKGKETDTTSIARRPESRERYLESTTRSLNSRGAEDAAFLASRRMESLTGIRHSTESDRASRAVNARDSDLTSIREGERDRRPGSDKHFDKESFARWEKEVMSQLDSIELEKKIETQEKLLAETQALLAQRKSVDKPAESGSGSSDVGNIRRKPLNPASCSKRPV
jgi:hypothetical protein